MRPVLISAAALAAAIAVGGVANAADLAPRRAPPPVKAPVYMPPAQPSWAGFYLGVNLGYGWGSGSGTLYAPGAIAISGSGDGILGGAQFGYNWQIDPWVFGLETDFQGTGIDGSITGTGFAATTHTPWFGTIRGRVGYSVDRWLFYLTGGGAYLKNDASGTLTGTAFSGSSIGWTWTVGGGVEAKLWPHSHWSAKLEYLYVGTPSSVPLPPGTTVSGSTELNIVRAGLNYHF